MTLRTIQWIADSGLLVGPTTIGEFDSPALLTSLSLSSTTFTLATPASGAILGASPGSAIIATGPPAGLTITAAPGWAYDGTGVAGSYTFQLIETLPGIVNSPRPSSITVTMAPPDASLDFSQSTDSSLIAALRSF